MSAKTTRALSQTAEKTAAGWRGFSPSALPPPPHMAQLIALSEICKTSHLNDFSQEVTSNMGASYRHAL